MWLTLRKLVVLDTILITQPILNTRQMFAVLLSSSSPKSPPIVRVICK